MGFPPLPGSSDFDAPDSADMTLGDAATPLDTTIIDAARAGDTDALGTLWCQHAPHIVRLLRAQRLRDPGLVANRIWRQVGDSIDQFAGNGEDFRRWVLKIASMHARNARDNSTTADATSVALAAGAFASAGDSGDRSIGGAINAVTVLPPELAEVVMLRHVHDLSIDDIAAVISTTDGEARRLVHSGTNELRRTLLHTDAGGDAPAGGAEATITSLLRQRATPDELLGETRGVEALLVAMTNPTHRFGRVSRPQPGRRRAVAAVAAGAILAGGAAFTLSVARDRSESATFGREPIEFDAADDDASENGRATAERTGDPTTLSTNDVMTPAEVAAIELEKLAAAEAAEAGSDDQTGDTVDAAESGTDDGSLDPDGDLPAPAAVPPRNETSRTGAPRPNSAPSPVNVPVEFDPRDIFPGTTTTTTAPRTRPPATPTTPTTRPPTTQPPTTRPPTTQPPTTRPPTTRPPTTPTTDAPPTPTTRPPTTAPPATTPPTTRPPITAPPTTRPPITAPPVTNPPVTNPPEPADPEPEPEPDDESSKKRDSNNRRVK